MPRATTSLETTRHPLKTAPPDGFVELRPMQYGDYLKRRDMALKMGVTGTQRGFEKVDVDLIQEAVTRFEFKICIADHNLEDENGRKLSLSEPNDFARLDPRIGQEISALIAEMIQWDDSKSEDEVPDSDRADDPVSQDGEPNT